MFRIRRLATFSRTTQLESMKRGVHSKRHAVCLDQTHSQVQLLPGAFSQGEVLLDEEADVLLLQLSLAL